MEDKTIPYIAFELTQAKHERTVKRLVTALILAIVLMFASNAAWLWAWCQYDYTSSEITVDSGSGGNANYIGNDGEIYNGTGHSEETDQN